MDYLGGESAVEGVEKGWSAEDHILVEEVLDQRRDTPIVPVAVH